MQEYEQNSHVIKEAQKATRDARKERDYYKGLAGMYQLTYEDDTAILEAEMILQGIFVELQSDLLKYKIKNGSDERVASSQKRLTLMANQLRIITHIQSNNYILKTKLREMEVKDHLQFEQIKELQHKLALKGIDL